LKTAVLMNSKGISVIFLIIAMLLMVTIGYVFSYLIPTKQKSVIFSIHSNQALFMAQSGVEYAIRYCSDRGWRGTTDTGRYDLTHLNDSGVSQRTLGDKRLTINYSNTTDGLTSTGEIIGSSEKRMIKVSNLTDFMRLIFDPASAAPFWTSGTQRALFSIKNVRTSNVTLTGFAAYWQSGVTRTITRMDMNGTQKYSGNYSSDMNLSPPVSFNRGGNSQAITPGQVINILIDWSGDTNATNIIIKFFTATGDGYAFNLDPEGNGL
jgi:hypothetical protein